MSSLAAHTPKEVQRRIWKELVDTAKNTPGIYFFATETLDCTFTDHIGFTRHVVLPRAAWNILQTCKELRDMAKADPDLKFCSSCIDAHVNNSNRKVLQAPLRSCRPKIDVVYIAHDQLEEFNGDVEYECGRVEKANRARAAEGKPAHIKLVDVSPFLGNISHIALPYQCISKNWQAVQGLLKLVGALPNLEKISVVFGPTWKRPENQPSIEFYEEPPTDSDDDGEGLAERWEIWGLTCTEPPFHLESLQQNIVTVGGKRIDTRRELEFKLEVTLNSYPGDCGDRRWNVDRWEPSWMISFDFVTMEITETKDEQ